MQFTYAVRGGLVYNSGIPTRTPPHSMAPPHFYVVAIVAACLHPVSAWSQTASPFFEAKAASVFNAKCGKCHSARVRKADLDLSSYAGVMRGGESGQVVAGGELSESYLWELVSDGQMPPDAEPQLTREELEAIRMWIAGGAKSARQIEGGKAASPTFLEVTAVLLRRCTMCHGPEYQRGGLDLRRHEQVVARVAADAPDDSLLLRRVDSQQCPPRDAIGEAGIEPMTPAERELLQRWIAAGATNTPLTEDVATGEGDALVSDDDRDFWSLRTVADPQTPTFRGQGLNTPIDAFLQRRLEEQGLRVGIAASRDVLARRAAYALTGLPLSTEQRSEFLSDDRPGAFGRLVDRLLASPAYGEKWARFWLDLAGYSDSEGKRNADTIRPYAWRYRDWVVRAFNADMPFDQFLLEQLAGDELVDWGAYQSSAGAPQEVVDKLIATGFLRMAPDGTAADPVNRLSDRLEVMSDTIDVFSRSILGLTMNCARCHTHKYDPIPQRDYYRLVAVFKGAYDEYDWLVPQPFGNQWKDARRRHLVIRTAVENAAVSAHDSELERQIAALRKEQASAAKEQAAKLSKRRKSLEGQLGRGPKIRALWDRGQPSPTFIYRRGDETQPASLVGPGVPSLLTDGKTPFQPVQLDHSTPKTGRRLALARWLIDPAHPLTSRVFVNRVWHQHFGRGIVESLDNFGRLGTPPSHPDLLDRLASDFIRHGWSLKRLHREILLSAAWQQASVHPAGSKRMRRDPENKWFSRMPLRRMTAEELRDSLLLAAGRLNRRMYGEPDPVEVRKDGLVSSKPIDGYWRRSVYLRQRRKEMPTLFETFDLPQMNPNCTSRKPSTVVSQPLHLLHNGLVRDWAADLARQARQASETAEGQVSFAFAQTMGRPPTDRERQACTEGLKSLRALASPDANAALVSFCHALFNTAGFLYVD